MMLFLEGVLAGEDVARVRRGLDEAIWRDGKATAGAAARAVKRNEQAAGADPRAQALGKFVIDAFRRHGVFMLAARPRRFSRVLFSRYEPGMEYGPHVDDALMGEGEDALRADLAFTLFLEAPETYAGGALIVDGAAGEQAVKLNAGDAVLYPATSIHRVEPVGSGARRAAVGWVQSFVRDAGRRELLFDLATARARLSAEGQDVLLLDKSIANLLRMWGE